MINRDYDIYDNAYEMKKRLDPYFTKLPNLLENFSNYSNMSQIRKGAAVFYTLIKIDIKKIRKPRYNANNTPVILERTAKNHYKFSNKYIPSMINTICTLGLMREIPTSSNEDAERQKVVHKTKRLFKQIKLCIDHFMKLQTLITSYTIPSSKDEIKDLSFLRSELSEQFKILKNCAIYLQQFEINVDIYSFIKSLASESTLLVEEFKEKFDPANPNKYCDALQDLLFRSITKSIIIPQKLEEDPILYETDRSSSLGSSTNEDLGSSQNHLLSPSSGTKLSPIAEDTSNYTAIQESLEQKEQELKKAYEDLETKEEQLEYKERELEKLYQVLNDNKQAIKKTQEDLGNTSKELDEKKQELKKTRADLQNISLNLAKKEAYELSFKQHKKEITNIANEISKNIFEIIKNSDQRDIANILNFDLNTKISKLIDNAAQSPFISTNATQYRECFEKPIKNNQGFIEFIGTKTNWNNELPLKNPTNYIIAQTIFILSVAIVGVEFKYPIIYLNLAKFKYISLVTNMMSDIAKSCINHPMIFFALSAISLVIIRNNITSINETNKYTEEYNRNIDNNNRELLFRYIKKAAHKEYRSLISKNEVISIPAIQGVSG